MQAIILIGIQGSGKTTFFRQRYADTHVRISLDLLGTRYREQALLETCLRIGQPLVVDNTNGTLKRLERPALSEGFDELYRIWLAEGGRFRVANWSKSEAMTPPA